MGASGLLLLLLLLVALLLGCRRWRRLRQLRPLPRPFQNDEDIQDDGGADIKHYIVEYFRDVWDVWLKAKTTKDCQATIEDLIPGSRWKIIKRNQF